MPLAPSCLDFVGAQLYVRPYHGWGWRRVDDSSVLFDYAAIEQAGGFSFTVAEILPWRGELRHITGTIQTQHSLFAGCWISCALMQEGTSDFQSRLCLRYDLSIGSSRPVGDWPEVASGSPIYGGYGTVGDSQAAVERFFANMASRPNQSLQPTAGRSDD
jgi:hypothetical protein